MILITPDDGPEDFSDSITSVHRQLSDLRIELDHIYGRIKSGELTDIKTARETVQDIRRWLKIAIEAEVHLEKRRKEKQGIVHDFAIDFEEAKSAIGSRLYNLRREQER